MHEALARGLERLLNSASQQRQRHVWRLQQLHDVSQKAKAAHAKLESRQIADQERQAKEAVALQAKAAARAARESRIQVRVSLPVSGIDTASYNVYHCACCVLKSYKATITHVAEMPYKYDWSLVLSSSSDPTLESAASIKQHVFCMADMPRTACLDARQPFKLAFNMKPRFDYLCGGTSERIFGPKVVPKPPTWCYATQTHYP